MATESTARSEIAIDSAAATTPIVVVADSHSVPHPLAYQWIEREEPTAILHAGDIGRTTVLDELEEIAPTFAVRGNIDGRGLRIPDHRVIDLERDGAAILRILLTHIGVSGPRIRKDAAAAARANGANLVICGHSHVPLIAGHGELSVFNPGSLGPRRFHLPITIGVLDVGERLGLRHIDCETGEPWQPPG